MTDFPPKSEIPIREVTSVERPSGSFPDVRLVAVAVPDEVLRAEICRIVHDPKHVVSGDEALGRASTVIALAAVDGGELQSIRARMLPGAALVIVARDARSVQGLDVHRLGAVACVRLPIVAEELRVALAVAEHARDRDEQVAELSRALDLQSQLASLGRVTAGISHEIANPLSSVMMNVESLQEQAQRLQDTFGLLQRIAADGESAHRHDARRALEQMATLDECVATLRDLDTECGRIGSLIGVMNELSARRPRTLEPLSIDEQIESIMACVPKELLAPVNVEVLIDDAARVRASRLLLEQTAVNFVTNAAHAVADVPAPKIRLHVYTSGSEGILSVRDNGPGIAPEMQPRIFEPFYTTRRGRGGTGLGLALCQEYVRQMGGRLTLWSALGRGACFRMHLMRASDAGAHA